ncbi:MAG TPA: PH domain-containing protein [Candidatus Nanoperiomorbaceae bacterium]|nr:PH domain-containing protein [Candidatus Nanoperiomorbaceae bacterium]
MEEQPDDRPVAYDAEGRPLYYHPESATEPVSDQTPPPAAPETTAAPEPTSLPGIEQAPASEPETKPPELEQKHGESVANYPELDVGPNEFVVIDVERSIVGLVLIWMVVCGAFLAFIITTVLVSQITVNSPYVLLIGFSLAVTCFIGGLIATYVYNQNYFIVTNERVIANVQVSPFSRMNQNVELEHIEDCSYTQSGVLQTLLNYGSIRLSTVGDEHTYRFNFVRDPSGQFQIVNRVVQAVDEGEPTKYKH